ncbi:hypothetical protein CEXT_656061 [Caerostris extrusa]|uniref:Uncharacterized protein n=1 Tax=Caerostris extrusa TaxID=172846 RepID=A0AAV4X0Q5_CAEEX|nr:hypothetical protein CEXT_656061 [Caerostris extrusa]
MSLVQELSQYFLGIQLKSFSVESMSVFDCHKLTRESQRVQQISDIIVNCLKRTTTAFFSWSSGTQVVQVKDRPVLSLGCLSYFRFKIVFENHIYQILEE